MPSVSRSTSARGSTGPRRARSRLIALGFTPSLPRIAEETGFGLDEIIMHFRYMAGVISLDAPVDTTDGLAIRDLVVDEATFANPAAAQYASEVRDAVSSALRSLKEREAAVLRLRFGLDGDEPCTLDAIGQHFGVTGERIRQIESKALTNLREPSRARVLREYH